MVTSTLHMRERRPREANDLPEVTLQEGAGPASTPPHLALGLTPEAREEVTPVAGRLAESCVFHGASRSPRPVRCSVKNKVSWSSKLRTTLPRSPGGQGQTLRSHRPVLSPASFLTSRGRLPSRVKWG